MIFIVMLNLFSFCISIMLILEPSYFERNCLMPIVSDSIHLDETRGLK